MERAFRLGNLSEYTEAMLKSNSEELIGFFRENVLAKDIEISWQGKSHIVDVCSIPKTLFVKFLIHNFIGNKALMFKEITPDEDCEEFCEWVSEKSEILFLKEKNRTKTYDDFYAESHVVAFLSDNNKMVLQVLTINRGVLRDIFEEVV